MEGLVLGFFIILCVTFDRLLYMSATKLTFHLSKSGIECFYQEIEANTSSYLEYQVLTGFNYEVCASIRAPNASIIYQEKMSENDRHVFTPQESGVYVACFSNEYCKRTTKTIYLDFHAGQDNPLNGNNKRSDQAKKEIKATKQEMTAAVGKVRNNLNAIAAHQIHHRVTHNRDMHHAQEHNNRVMYLSLFEMYVIVLAAMAQVFTLKYMLGNRSRGKLVPRP